MVQTVQHEMKAMKSVKAMNAKNTKKAMKAMKAKKAKAKGKGKAMNAGNGSVPAKKQDTDVVKVAKPKAPSLRNQIMKRLRECTVEDVLREAKERMASASQAVAECESTFKATKDEFMALQETADAAKAEQNQALQLAKYTRAKQIELQRKMAVLQKAEHDVACEVKMIERQRSLLDEVGEAKRLAQEAKDAVTAARMHEKELAMELKESRKKARAEQRLEELECGQEQKQIKHVFVKLKELEHKKLKSAERALAQKEGKLTGAKRSAINPLPVSHPIQHCNVECSADGSTKQLSDPCDRIMASPVSAHIGDSLTSNLFTQHEEQTPSNNDAQCYGVSQELTLML
eukprot:gnl/MRDRNA2_/MRDRNA2_91502_c0_seq1.p1 gnl/MRDRNA2_/MRDRNA2_91502_c0~~gnl/MRDRNA2_/MRDRNA2_91502_c0_seq1.p1  ORF type:complete len:345 (+),score=110.02 gnl/MRDRNA2_/MRDRNA2_91502_c0_seq1:107-1141(+)